MGKPFRKIFLLFTVVVLLPTLIFSLYEVGSYRQNEEIIEEIYTNQLDAILFSVKQYADDVLNDIRREITQKFNSPDISEEELNSFISTLPAIKYSFIASDGMIRVLPKENEENISNVQNIISENQTNYNKLKEYYLKNYVKIESIESPDSEHLTLIFVCKDPAGNLCEAGIVIDSYKFIHEELDSKIQQIAADKFLISVMDTVSGEVFYSSDKNAVNHNPEYLKEFWQFKNFKLGIEMTGQTISDLVKSRAQRNILLIVFIDILLLLGSLLIFRNIKKNMELAQIKSDFISNVSHEIRTPLALISMYIETLEMGRIKSEDKRNEYYKIILEETSRLSSMVNKILNFSQIEKGKKQYSFSEANINEIVEEIFTTYQYHLANKGFAYEFIKDELLSTITLDREAAKDAIINLIDNAIKYSTENKVIETKTRQDSKAIYVDVKDYGIGISEKDKNHIFDKFFRVTEGNLAHKAKGTGLGLTIVKHTMDAHKGKISIWSKPGEGSIFTLVFPKKIELN